MQNGHRRFCSIVFSPLPSFYTLYCIIVFPAVQAVRILVQKQKDPGPAAQRADRLRSYRCKGFSLMLRLVDEHRASGFAMGLT